MKSKKKENRPVERTPQRSLTTEARQGSHRDGQLHDSRQFRIWRRRKGFKLATGKVIGVARLVELQCSLGHNVRPAGPTTILSLVPLEVFDWSL